MSTSRYSPDCSSPVTPGELHPFISNPFGCRPDDLGLVGHSAAMQRLRLQVRRIGPHFRSVLLSGERGTGKQSVARALHSVSRGAAGPFVVCDAATLISPALDHASIEESGAGRIGWLMQAARQGTLFFDDIGEMPLETQAQLLRILRRYGWAQDGCATGKEIGTRIIVAANQDLRVLASTGRFRVELYQKIATVQIPVPALRERKEDIQGLAMHFLQLFAETSGAEYGEFSNAALATLKNHDWPGNVRELEDFVRSCISPGCGEVLDLHHLPPFGKNALDAGWPEKRETTARLQDVIERHVLNVLSRCEGNKVRTAELLGISRSTLYRMLEETSCQ